MAIRGDIGRLKRHRDRVERLGSPESMRSLTNNMAEEALFLVEEVFAKETDPYGKRWPAKVFNDGRQVLVGKTKQLRGGWHRTRSDGRGFRISSTAPYAKYHQGGTGIYGPSKHRIYPKHGKALAFFAEKYVTVQSARSLRKYMSSAFAVNPKAAKKALKKELSKGSTIMLRSVKGCPPRLMVPKKGKLPKAWGEALADVADEWFRKKFDK